MLILPDCAFIPEELEEWLEHAAHVGFPVFFAGERPAVVSAGEPYCRAAGSASPGRRPQSRSWEPGSADLGDNRCQSPEQSGNSGGRRLDLTGGWKVSFREYNEDSFGPSEIWTSLKNVTGQEQRPEFSGTIRYEISFDWDPGTDGLYATGIFRWNHNIIQSIMQVKQEMRGEDTWNMQQSGILQINGIVMLWRKGAFL